MKKLILFLFVSAISVQAQVGPEQARNYQINEAHTGAINVSGVLPPLKQKWSRNFGQDMSYPLVADGKVYVTVRYASVFGTELYALNAADGATLWSYPLGGSASWSASCYENGRVFALNNSGLLRAFDGDTGNVIWSRQLSGTNFTSAPTVFQGVIYIGGSASGTAHAVSAETGNVLWSKTVGAGNTTAALTTDGVYLSYSCIDFSRLNPADGSLIWRNYGACGSGTGRAPAIYNGRAYVRTPSYSLDQLYYIPQGGYAGDFISKSAPAFSGNTGFFLNGNRFGPPPGVLEARDLTTNAVLWSFIGDGLLQSAILVVNDYVYIGSGSGKLYALKASNGEEVWSTTAGTSIPVFNEQTNTQPMTGFAAGDGILVVPTKTTLVAYETDYSPTITWGSPIPAPNSLGWNNTAVQLPFTAVARPPSGLAFATPESPLQFNNEGDNQTQQVSVIDQVGNTATLTSPLLRIDLTAPLTNSSVAGTVGPGVTQWYRDSAQVTLTRTDNLSGIQLTSYTLDGVTQPYGSPFTIRIDGSHTLNYWSSDRAGNIETQQSRVINVDSNAPVTQISTGSGFYASPTQVTLTATDSSSGVANTFYQYAFGPTQTYSGPFTATGDGPQSVVFWSTDWAGHVENQHSVTLWLDGSAPSTAIALSGTASNGWRNTPVQITLSPTDARSGVAATYYTVDGGPTQTYSGAFTVDGSAVHQVSYWSVDNVGNTEVQKSAEVKIDKEAPTTQSSLSGPLGNNDYYTGNVQVTLTATDNLSGLASSATSYKIDNGFGTAYPGSPITVSGNGTHTVSFWSRDAAGNTESPTTITIKIDSSAPVTQATLAGTQGSNGWYTDAAQITLSATDTPSGVETTFYKLDNGAQQTYSAPFSISDSGYHALIYWSVDRAGNTESQRSMQIRVDSVAPTSQASASSTSWFDVWYQSPAQVFISATDSASGIATTYYTLDGGPTQTYTAAFNISAGGVHVVNYWSVDQAGNTEAQKSLTVRVDSAAPTTQIAVAGTGANGWYQGPVQVGLTATDPEAGVNVTMYRVDNGPTMVYGGTPFTVSGEGQHTVLYWSNDKLDHTEAQNSATIRIDSTLPSAQSSFSGPVGGNGYYIGPVQFTMTGTDNLSGLANMYYRVNGGVPLVYSSPFTIGVDGNYSVDYWSVDVAGNISVVGTAFVKIDVSTPLTQATGSGTAGTNGWYRSAVQVSLAAADNLSGVQTTFYKVDGGTTKTYTTTFGVSGNGSHTVNFWSVDKAGNTETMRSFVFNIDTNQPGVTCNVVPSTAAPSSTPVTITVTGHATDTVSSVSITDGATFSVVDEYGVTQPSGPITLQSNGNYSFTLTLPATKNVGDSTHVYTITVRGTDRAGNTNTASDTLKIN